VRGGGIDGNALGHICQQHAAAVLQFVDGWTGNGASAWELAARLTELGRRNGSAPSKLV
jgi:Phosphoribosyl transferase (PRTase)